jgi:hypothetical protein
VVPHLPFGSSRKQRLTGLHSNTHSRGGCGGSSRGGDCHEIEVSKLSAFALALALLFCVQIGCSQADVVYNFAFTNLSGDTGGVTSFNISITEPDFITMTGMSPLSAPVSTPLYVVNNFGTNIHGWFAFSNTGGAIIDVPGVSFSSTTFDFKPIPDLSNYITSPGDI